MYQPLSCCARVDLPRLPRSPPPPHSPSHRRPPSAASHFSPSATSPPSSPPPPPIQTRNHPTNTTTPPLPPPIQAHNRPIKQRNTTTPAPSLPTQPSTNQSKRDRALVPPSDRLEQPVQVLAPVLRLRVELGFLEGVICWKPLPLGASL